MDRIQKKSWLWNLVPLAGRNRFSTTLFSTIYLAPKAYKDYRSKTPSASVLALVEHEKIHVRQYREEGIRCCLKYLLSPKARFSYEVDAFAAQIFFLSQARPQKREAYLVSKAKLLSSLFPYLLFIPYGTAIVALREELKRLEGADADV